MRILIQIKLEKEKEKEKEKKVSSCMHGNSSRRFAKWLLVFYQLHAIIN
jgi:hypothetical protein